MFKRILLFYLAITATPAHAMQFLNYARQAGARLRASYAQASVRSSTKSLVPSRIHARTHGSRFSSSSSSRSSRVRFSTLNSHRSFAPRLAAGIAIGVAGYTAMQATQDNTIHAQPLDYESIKRHSPRWALPDLLRDNTPEAEEALVAYLKQPHTLEEQEYIFDYLSAHKDQIQLTPEFFAALLRFKPQLVSTFMKDYAQALPARLNVLLESPQL